jgi:hypothetical protein
MAQLIPDRSANEHWRLVRYGITAEPGEANGSEFDPHIRTTSIAKSTNRLRFSYNVSKNKRDMEVSPGIRLLKWSQFPIKEPIVGMDVYPLLKMIPIPLYAKITTRAVNRTKSRSGD